MSAMWVAGEGESNKAWASLWGSRFHVLARKLVRPCNFTSDRTVNIVIRRLSLDWYITNKSLTVHLHWYSKNM